MITKEQARKIAEVYLKTKKRNYTSICPIEKISFWQNQEILHGKHEGKFDDIYSVNYGEIWGNEERSIFIKISASTGEVLYTLSPHGWVEQKEGD